MKLCYNFECFPDLFKFYSNLDPTGLGCTVHCPIPCGPGHMTCYGAFDSNGCMMPDTCIPMTGSVKRFR